MNLDVNEAQDLHEHWLLLEALARSTGPVVVCDAGGSVRLVSEDARELLGPLEGLPAGAADAAVDDTPASEVAGGAPGGGPGPLVLALAGVSTVPHTRTIATPDGRPVEVLVSARPLAGPSGELLGAALWTRRQSPSTEVDPSPTFGLHDLLTGLPNRSLLGDRVEQACARMRRGGPAFEVLMIDLDRFKQVNDEYGHEYGDRVLREVADRFARTVRPADTVARVGGDEFVVLCEQLDPVLTGDTIADRLVAATVEPVHLPGLDVTVGASIGLTVGSADDSLDTLLHQADLAMYEAKRGGRNRWARYDETLATDAHRRAHLVTELRRSLAAGELEVAFQPLVDLQTGRTCGYEALVRWYHPQLGPVAAEELIGVAERSDLIVPVGAFVLDRACATAARQVSGTGPPSSIAVNLSARELADPELADRVQETLDRHGLDPVRLTLEITESNLIDATLQVGSQLSALRKAGVSLAIDDFGTGFASLTYLQRLPVQQVKIDRSFVAGLPANREDDVIVTSVIGLAHNLDLTVVAEGIETPAQAAFLRALGCDLGQGHLFGRALPADELPETTTWTSRPSGPAVERR